MAATDVQQKASNTAVQHRDLGDVTSGKTRGRPLTPLYGYAVHFKAALLWN